MMILIAVLLPVEAGAAGAGGITAPACAPGWVAPHLLQNLAPSASGFPQLTQNVAIYGPSTNGRMLRSQRVPVKSIREAVSCFWFPVSSSDSQTSLGVVVSGFLQLIIHRSSREQREETRIGMLIPRPDRLAKSNDQGDRDLSCHTRFPSRGNVRPGQPAETISRVRREQDCRRAGKIVEGRVPTFLGQARGSLIEMETQLVIARNLGFLSSNTIAALIGLSGEVSRLPHGLMKSLQPAEPTARTRNQKLETAPGAKLCHLYG